MTDIDTHKIYDMQLHEEIKINLELYIMRVPGGWIYRFYDGDGINSSCIFVPYKNELYMV